MELVNLEQLNKKVLFLTLEVARLKRLLEERNLEVIEDVVDEVEDSRAKSHEEFISNEEMKSEFGE